MAVYVRINPKANEDLDVVIAYLSERSNDQEAINDILLDLAAAIQTLADRELVKGREIKGLSSQFREWVVLDDRYRIYYTRSTAGFDVWRIRFKNQPLLTPAEIVSK